jgi:hypothetical protein
MRLRLLGATVAAVAVLAVAGQGAGAVPAVDYKKLIVMSGKKSAAATLGTRCHPGVDGAPGDCAEAKYPLKTTGTVPLRAGERLTLLLGAPATDVRWRAARVDGLGKEQLIEVGVAFPATKTQKRWRVHMPKKLSKRIKILGFDVVYKNAYSSFEVGARVTRTRARTGTR